MSSSSVNLGNNAGQFDQQTGSIAIGQQAGQTSQGTFAVAIGQNSGQTNQSNASVAIGQNAGQVEQSEYSISIGQNAGQNSQNTVAVALGQNAGQINQSDHAIAIGQNAGQSNQGSYSIAIGTSAGQVSQGEYSIAIGHDAGQLAQPAHSIVLNAQITGVSPQTTGLFIQPLRNASQSNTLYYNDATSEITYYTSTAEDKTDITSLPFFQSASIYKLLPRTFTYTSDGIKNIGLIAEEVFAVDPDLVVVDASGNPINIKWFDIVTYLVSEIKKHQTQILNQAQQMQSLQSLVFQHKLQNQQQTDALKQQTDALKQQQKQSTVQQSPQLTIQPSVTIQPLQKSSSSVLRSSSRGTGALGKFIFQHK